MMFSLPLMLLALMATAVAGQENQTGPWLLHIKGGGLDGYGAACHAGAAIEGLCYSPGQAGTSTSFQFYFNYTGYNQFQSDEVGYLLWKLPVNINDTDVLLPSSMSLSYQPNSNVAAPMFGTSSYGGTSVGFDVNKNLFVYSSIDDATFTPGTPPNTTVGQAYYQWFVCWEYLIGYYYQAVGWAQTLPPRNPTCVAVEITQEPAFGYES